MSRTDTKIISVIMSFVVKLVVLAGGILKVCNNFCVRVKTSESLHKSGAYNRKIINLYGVILG